MSISRIASRYAKSLMDLSREQGVIDLIFRDMQGFQKALESRDFYNFLRSPVISTGKKLEIFKQLFEGKCHEVTYRFFQLLMKKGRESVLPEVILEFIKLYRKHKNIILLTITTAVPLSKESIQKVEYTLKKSGALKGDIEWITKVNPTIIGGFKVEFDHQLIDASIQHKLDLMRRELAINLYESK
jgi:F-type H+-transporting ATPase subunit delta